MSYNDSVKVLFVCLGNICRSTMAQGVLQHLVAEQKLGHLVSEVDSCGTGAYHVGNAPDSRTLWTLQEHGITLDHAARQLEAGDFAKFDYILAMDRENLAGIQAVAARQRKAPGDKEPVICLFGEYGPGKEKVIQDPYYGSSNAGFDKAYAQSIVFGEGLLEEIEQKYKSSL